MNIRKRFAAVTAAAMIMQCMAAGISAEDFLCDPIVKYEEDPSFVSDGVSENNEEEVYDRIISGYEQGASSDTSFSYGAGAEGIAVPSDHKTVQLDDGLIKYSDEYSTFAETVCEEKGGVYFVSNNNLIFYSLTDFTTTIVRTFSSIYEPYFANNKLYYISDDSCNVYDLLTGKQVMSIDPGLSMLSVGADDKGRIYIAGYDSEKNYYIILFSPEGAELSRLERDEAVYDIYGFNSTNGDFYFEAFCNWRYWGYDHYGRSVNIGNVTDNVITEINIGNSVNMGGLNVGINGIEFIEQSYYSPGHQRNVDLIDNNYLVTVSSAFGRKQIIDPVGYKAYQSMTNVKGSQYTSGTYGTRTVYFPYNDTIITSDEGNDIIEYSPKEEKTLNRFTAAHPIFSVMRTGKNIILLEKEGNTYYIETVKWAGSTEISISASSGMKAGEYQKAVVTGNSVLNERYLFSSDNPSVASVSDEGVIAAWSEGTAVISCRSEFGTGTAYVTVNVTAADTPAYTANSSIGGKVSSNISQNNYYAYGKTVKSYLYENADGTFTRVEYIDSKVFIEKYSRDNKLLDTKTIEPELPIFGGAFSGKNYNFLVFGQANTSESDSAEVMRAVKYDKNWNRLGAFSAYGANTYIPFDAGSLRMAETGDRLYIYTCHKMYASEDGLHHQANMTFVISQSDMTEEQSYYDVMNNSYGYVSHSFNQFVQTDGTYVYRMDHGDAYPRGFYISKCDVNGKITNVSYWVTMQFKGGTGNNYTGASLGGMELSDSNIIAVGNTIDQESDSSSDVRNIFAMIIAKDLGSKNIIMLTEHAENSDITARTPQLVKITDEHFLIMWEEYNKTDYTTTLQAALMNSSGEIISRRQMKGYSISDCQPVATSYGSVKWYVTDGKTAKMYEYFPFVSDPIESFVERLYTTMLGRPSEAAGKADWVNRLRNGATATEVSNGFVLSEELALQNLTNTEFVTRMYRTFMNREPDAAGLADWTNALDSGCSYAFVLNSFVLSTEFGNICNTYGIETGRYEITEPRDVSRNLTAFTSRMYTKALNRAYEVNGLNYWTGRYINREISLNDMAYGFIFSEEFTNRNLSDEQYVDTLYATFFDRAPDETGKADWLGQLNSGSATREQVLNGFLGATEFENLVKSFDL